VGQLPKTVYEINKKRKKKYNKQKLNYERARQHQNGVPDDIE
jgi:hypothetical protein